MLEKIHLSMNNLILYSVVRWEGLHILDLTKVDY